MPCVRRQADTKEAKKNERSGERKEISSKTQLPSGYSIDLRGSVDSKINVQPAVSGLPLREIAHLGTEQSPSSAATSSPHRWSGVEHCPPAKASGNGTFWKRQRGARRTELELHSSGGQCSTPDHLCRELVAALDGDCSVP